jgi:hypothetical protein
VGSSDVEGRSGRAMVSEEVFRWDSWIEGSFEIVVSERAG